MGIGIDRTGLTQFFWRYDLRRPWAPILRCLKGQAGMASRHFGHENTTADDIYTKSPSPLGERRSNTNSGFCIVLKQETCPGTQTHSHTHLSLRIYLGLRRFLSFSFVQQALEYGFSRHYIFWHLRSFGSVAHLARRYDGYEEEL